MKEKLERRETFVLAPRFEELEEGEEDDEGSVIAFELVKATGEDTH
jgi:hypothetical protein